MKVLIVEDEKLAADRLSKMLTDAAPDAEIIAVLDTVDAAVKFLQDHTPDLLFLDIQLGDGKSFEIFQHTNVSSYIIFTTAFDEYAIQAFKYNSIDYLLKPLKKKELEFALDKFRKQSSPNIIANDLHLLLKQLRPVEKELKKRFLVKKGSRLLSVETENVAFAFTKDRIHYIKTFEGEDYFIDNNLDELEEQLDPEFFFRANRQFILNYKSVDKIFNWFDGKLKVVPQPVAYEDVMVSRLRANSFKKWMGK